MNWVKNVINFYSDGFKNMSINSKKLWIIVFIKLFIMFAILKTFFFPNFLNTKFKTDKEKSNYVGTELVNKKTVQPNEEQQ